MVGPVPGGATEIGGAGVGGGSEGAGAVGGEEDVALVAGSAATVVMIICTAQITDWDASADIVKRPSLRTVETSLLLPAPDSTAIIGRSDNTDILDNAASVNKIISFVA